MGMRTGHGRGAGVPRIEVLPPDELPAGVPAETGGHADPAAAVQRDRAGRVADAASAAVLGRLGAMATNARRRQLRALAEFGLHSAPDELLPYLADAQEFSDHETERLATTVGGGVCGAAPASLVQSAALQLAGSRAAFAKGDVVAGSRLANDSRQNLLAAHELCAREAKARPQPQDALWGRLGFGNDGKRQ
jgi:hypothetical protein